MTEVPLDPFHHFVCGPNKEINQDGEKRLVELYQVSISEKRWKFAKAGESYQ
jgi:hypothetical protein